MFAIWLRCYQFIVTWWHSLFSLFCIATTLHVVQLIIFEWVKRFHKFEGATRMPLIKCLKKGLTIKQLGHNLKINPIKMELYEKELNWRKMPRLCLA